MADGEPGTGGPMGKDAIAAGVAKWSDSDLMSQLRKTFGFEGTANELVRIDVSSLHVFLAQLGEKLQQHEELVLRPPWLEHLSEKLKLVDTLERQVASLHKKLAGRSEPGPRARPEAPERLLLVACTCFVPGLVGAGTGRILAVQLHAELACGSRHEGLRRLVVREG